MNTMRITKRQLRRIIREEAEKMSRSGGIPAKDISWSPVERSILSGPKVPVMLVPNTDGMSHRVVGTPKALADWAEEIDRKQPGSMFSETEGVPGRWDAVSGPAFEQAEREFRYISRYM